MTVLTEKPRRLIDLTGIDPDVADRMRAAGFTDVEHVSAATQSQLQTVEGISSGLAARLLVETERIEPSESVRNAVAEIAVAAEPEADPQEREAEPIETLTDITGVDRELAKRLREQGFQTVEHVSGANSAQLAAVDGIGVPFAERILAETENIEVSPELREELAEFDEEPPSRWGPDAYLIYAVLVMTIAAGALYTGATTVGIGLIGVVLASGTIYDFVAKENS